jgi:hypothetical protein
VPLVKIHLILCATGSASAGCYSIKYRHFPSSIHRHPLLTSHQLHPTMSDFTYRAIDQRAATVEGTISADSPRAARDLLRGRGLTVEQVTEQAEARTRIWWPWRKHSR